MNSLKRHLMIRLTWFMVLFFCLGPFMLAPVSARVDEEEFIKRVRAAQGDVNSAKRELQQMQAKYQPVIDRYEAAEAEVARLAAAWQANRETLWDDANKEKELPKSLEARKDALLEHYSRMQLLHLKDKSSANKTKLDRSKRAYEEVQRQIRDFNAGNALAKRRFAAAEARSDRLWAQYEKARDRLPVQRQDAQSGEDRIAAARAALSSTRDALEKAKSEARWRLNENAPPYLQKVVVRRGGETFYEAEWGFDEEKENKEELLRLAQYLHEDLGRTIPQRIASVKRWGDEVEAAIEKMLAANQAYKDLIDWSSPKNLAKDAILMAIGTNVLASPAFSLLFGSHPLSNMSHAWRKTGVEIADSAITIGRDVAGGAPPHKAILAEAVSQVGDVLFRAVLGQAKNPSWAASGAIPQKASGLSDAAEQALIKGVTKVRIRNSLELIRDQVKAALEGEDFRQQLVRRYQGETLAIALTQTALTRDMPRLEGLKQWNPGGSILDSTFNFFTQPSGAMKTLLKTRFLEGTPGDAPTPFKDIGLDLLQSSIRDMALGQSERERLEVEYAWHAADVKLQMTTAHYNNEVRLRRIDQRIQKILAEQLIPELTAEVERLRASRELDIVKDAEVKDEQATLVMTFSDEVDIERVTLADVELAAKNKRDTWEARIDLEQFEDADAAQLTVVARPPAFDDRQLDDPRTVASWSTQTSSFNAYEQKPDTHHKIRLKPEEIAGEIAYYPSCITSFPSVDLIADMETISRRGGLTGGIALPLQSQSLLGIDRLRNHMRSKLIQSFQEVNQELEVLPGKRKRYFYVFPVVSLEHDKNRLFCIPGQPCYLEKDGGLYSEDNEWLKLAVETHKKGIIELSEDAYENWMREEDRDVVLARKRDHIIFLREAIMNMMIDNSVHTCEWWAPQDDDIFPQY